MLAKIKGWYQVFSIETGGPEWKNDLLDWESRFGRERTESALVEAHYRATDFNHFTAPLIMGCVPAPSGRREADPNCPSCKGQGMKPGVDGRYTRCDCKERPQDFKERASGE